MDLNEKIEKIEESVKKNTKKVIDRVSNNFKEDVGGKQEKCIKPLVSARVLFIGVLDKIFLVVLALMLVFITVSVFDGSISSLEYGYFARVLKYILGLLGLVLLCFLFNYIYKCLAKTMLCVTSKEVYKESYFPFVKKEVSIPLSKITKVSVINIFWIFKAVVISKYNGAPMVFWTSNNREVKDKINELIKIDYEKIENTYENKNILSIINKRSLYILGLCVIGIVLLVGVFRLFGYVFNKERLIANNYHSGSLIVSLKDDRTCDIDDLVDEKVTSCTWDYDKDSKKVYVTYKYRKYGFSEGRDNIVFDYDSSRRSLSANGVMFVR